MFLTKLVAQEVTEFTCTVLTHMFHHSNFASFVIQLNKYSFRKVSHTLRLCNESSCSYVINGWESTTMSLRPNAWALPVTINPASILNFTSSGMWPPPIFPSRSSRPSFQYYRPVIDRTKNRVQIPKKGSSFKFDYNIYIPPTCSPISTSEPSPPMDTIQSQVPKLAQNNVQMARNIDRCEISNV